MNSFEFNLFPRFPFISPFTPIEPDFYPIEDNFYSPGSFFNAAYSEFFKPFSDCNLHSPARINAAPSMRMQKTSLKVHDAQISWKANVGTPADINRSLDRLESMEKAGWQRAEMLAQINAARPVVAKAVSSFEEIQSIEKDLIQRRNELRQKAKSPEITEQLKLVSDLLAEVRKLNLPEQLTQDSVEHYANNARQAADKWKSQLIIQPAQKTSTHRADIIKTKAKSFSLFNAVREVKKLSGLASSTTALLNNESKKLEKAKVEFKNSEKQFLQTTQLAAEVENMIKQAPADKTDRGAVEAYAAAATALLESNQAHIEELRKKAAGAKAEDVAAPASVKEQTVVTVSEDDIAIKAIKDNIFATASSQQSSFDRLFKELNYDHPEIEENFRDIRNIRQEELFSLEEDAKHASSLKELSVCAKQLEHYEIVNGIILNQIRDSAANAKLQEKKIGDNGSQAKILMSKVAGFNLQHSIQATYDAIVAFLKADKRTNEHIIKEITVAKEYFQNQGFDKIVQQYTDSLRKLKEAEALFKIGDNIEKLDKYRAEWNQAEDWINENKTALSDLKYYDQEMRLTLLAAEEAIEEWEMKFQFHLADELKEMLEQKPSIKQKATLSIDGLDAYNKEINDFCDQINEFIDISEEVPLPDVIAIYENSDPDRAAKVKERFLKTTRESINEFLSESYSHISKGNSSMAAATRQDLQKLIDEITPLLTSFEISSGIFGWSKESVPVEKLSTANLKKYEDAVASRLSLAKEELNRLLTS